eukprot:Pgem_evm1s10219
MKHTSEKGFTYSATVYADRNRHYFVSSHGTTDEGIPIKYNDIVDRHNRRRQDALNIEKKLEFKNWKNRMTSTLLARALIFNTYDNITTRERNIVIRSNGVIEFEPKLKMNMKKQSRKRNSNVEYSETIRRMCSYPLE